METRKHIDTERVRTLAARLKLWLLDILLFMRLRRHPHGARLVLYFMLGDRLRGLATPAPVFADSS